MSDDILIRLGLKGQQQVSRGLREVKKDAQDVGTSTEQAGMKAEAMGARFARAGDHATVSLRGLAGAIGVTAGAGGLGRLTVAGVKWGLSFNAQVESARLRFGLFTNDVDGLTKAVQKIDLKSQFNFADLSDAAALFGNNGIKDIPDVLQATANAAAASGKGTEGFKSIAIALSQIAAKGRLSQEEVNQLNEAGAPGAQRIIAHHFHLTAKELQNLGGQGLDATEALKALTDEWTSGKMAKAAEAQTKTLGGQWQLLTGNMQKAAGAATEGLAHSLEKNVLPAANRASEAITKIFGDDGLSNQEKLRRARAVIKRELGPIADDLKDEIDKADIPGKLGEAVKAALPKMAEEAGKIAPDVAKAFVDAWLASGPWVKLLTALAIWKKLGTPGLPGSKGGLKGALGKATPVPVYVTNWGGNTPGSGGATSKVKDAIKAAGPTVVAAATRAAPVAGAVGAAVTTDVFAAELFRHFFPDVAKHNYPTRGPGASSPSSSNGYGAPPGFGGAMPGLPPGGLTVSVVVNDREVATATAAGNAKQRARK